ncbi:MAG: TIR domain-containing protein [Clostridia bacterium]|nr:TIR domain-containing protein [Clostridia bacterium]
MGNVKVPLTVYVLWHPEFEDGYFYAREIYSYFTRDIENPVSRGIGIPLLFSSEGKVFEHKIKIDFDKSERTVIIIFIDDKILLDNEWYTYVEQLQNKCDKNSKHIIYPVAIIKQALNLPVNNIKSKNYIRLFEKSDEDEKIKYLIFSLAHELCRFLYGIERISEVDNTQSPPPVKLFLSHAKSDGITITESIWEYIKLNTPLDDFFDAQDIAPGYDFVKEIESAISNSMLLVIHTDNYSSRKWCRKEILISKELSIPILVLDCLCKLEKRSFPYMANVQTLRIREDEKPNCEEIITISLLEVLRHKYQLIYINFILKSFEIDICEKNILSYPPELFSLVQTIDKEESIVVYPDPPLGADELALLKQYKTDLQFVTPTMLYSIYSRTKNITERPLKGFDIGISISEISEENLYGLNMLHLQDMMVEIARYLIAAGAQLSYGGDIRYRKDFNFVDILTTLVENHNHEHEKINQKITNYVANYLRKSVSEQIQSDLINVVKFKFIEPLDSLDYSSCDVFYSRYVRARDLTNMREQMNRDISARIIIGGKTQGYQGAYPGLLEEVILAMNVGKPVYLIGAFGGITQEIIKCVLGEKSEVLSEEYQFNYGDYNKSYKYYNERALANSINPIDYESITTFLKDKGIKGLNNGLTDNENKILFQSTNIIQIISLILKALSNG